MVTEQTMIVSIVSAMFASMGFWAFLTFLIQRKDRKDNFEAHSLTLSQFPPHSHKTLDKRGYAFFGGERVYDPAGPAAGTGYATDPNFLNTGSAGSGEAHNNLQPYITVYMWRRTA